MSDETIVDVSPETIRQAVREFITLNFLYGDTTTALEDNVPLLEAGIVDTTGILELVLFVEETFGVSVEDSDLEPENFDTVNSIVAFVAERIAA